MDAEERYAVRDPDPTLMREKCIAYESAWLAALGTGTFDQIATRAIELVDQRMEKDGGIDLLYYEWSRDPDD